MEKVILNLLSALIVSAPALLYRPLNRKRYFWCFLLFVIVETVLPEFPLWTFVSALLLGLSVYWAVYRPAKQGRLFGLSLCWSACVAALNAAHFFREFAETWLVSWLALLPLLLVGLALAFGVNWLSRSVPEDDVQLSDDAHLSPRPILLMILALQVLLTLLGQWYPLGCAAAVLLLQIIMLMILSLWYNMSLVARRGLESSETSRQSVQALERASRSSEADLLRKLTENSNRLRQASLAYQTNDQGVLSSLLGTAEDQDSGLYCSSLLLNAILRHGASEARKAGIMTNFRLQLGDLHGFPLSDVGVLLNLMLDLMCEHHQGAQDTLHLRAQEWSDALIITVGRRSPLLSVPSDKMNALRSLTEEFHGWMEFTEKEKSICLSVVIFRRTPGELISERPLK